MRRHLDILGTPAAMSAELGPLEWGAGEFADRPDIADRRRKADLWFDLAHVPAPGGGILGAGIVADDLVVLRPQALRKGLGGGVGLDIGAFGADVDGHQWK